MTRTTLALIPRVRTALVAIAVGTLVAIGAATPATAAQPNSISGTVTAEVGGAPLPAVGVLLEDADGNEIAGSSTDSDGYYEITDVPPGTYTVYFDTQSNPGEQSKDYVSEWYSNAPFASGATTVELLDGEALTVDASLALGGSISGSFSPSVPAGVIVRAFEWDAVTSEWVLRETTSGTTAFTLRGLRGGASIRVWFQETSILPRGAAEFYSNATSFATAQDVVVTAGASTPIGAITLGPGGSVAHSRFAGTDRFDTAAQLAAEFESADTVYIANGLNFPDALGAAPAAALAGAPLLLTAPTFLPDVAAAQLSRLDPSSVVIMGSTASVSAEVQSAIAELLPGADITRIAGTDRFDTSRQLARFAFPDGADKVYLVTGLNFPDALSVASVAASAKGPIILVNVGASALDSATKDLLLELGATSIDGIYDLDVEIIGSPASVSQGIYNSIFDIGHGVFVTRIGGANRYETSAWANYPYSDRPADTVYLATGLGFADALAGGAIAGRDGAPLFIAPGTCVTADVRAAIYDLSPQKIVLLGGTPSLSIAVESLTQC